MSDKVVSFPVISNEPHPDIVAAAERLLTRAKSGDIVSMAVAIESRDGGTMTMYCRSDKFDMARLMGAVEYLKYRLLQLYDTPSTDG